MELVNTNFNLLGARNRHQQIVFFSLSQNPTNPLPSHEKN